MIYSLYHWFTGTHMDDNGLPGWADALGGVLDLALLAAVLYGVSTLL